MPRREGSSWASDQLSKRLLKQARTHNTPCYICGQKIDYRAHYNAPDAPTVDHIRSWRDHPELRLDPGNQAVCHRSCNASKSVKARALPAHGNASRDWSQRQG